MDIHIILGLLSLKSTSKRVIDPLNCFIYGKGFSPLYLNLKIFEKGYRSLILHTRKRVIDPLYELS